MEAISPTPIPLADYTEQLEDIQTLIGIHNNLVANQYELMQGQYVATLFCIGVVGAIFVLVLLYNLLKKCY